MKYPSIRKQPEYTVTVPQLNGGLNKSVSAHLIEDNQLSDVCNMWYKDGMLQTRPGAVVKTHNAESATGNFYPFVQNVGDSFVLYDYSSEEAGSKYFNSEFSVALLNMEGELLDSGWKLGWMAPKKLESVLSLPISSAANEEISEMNSIFIVGFSDGSIECFGYRKVENEDGAQGDHIKKVEPYIPCVIVEGRPKRAAEATVNGTMLEPYNLLTPYFECKYTTDGQGEVFSLPTTEICDEFSVEYIDNKGTRYTHNVSVGDGIVVGSKGEDGLYLALNSTTGTFMFLESETGNVGKVLELSPFVNNVVARAKQKNFSEKTISHARATACFGGGSSGLSSGTRIFVSGDPKHPNLVHWSALNNPLYFPENNFAYVGRETSAVTAFGRQGDLLVIFKEREIYCTQYNQGSSVSAEDLIDQRVIDIEAAAAVFPMTQIHPEIGCDCPDTICLCNNRLTWLNSDGTVYGLFTTGQYNERNVRELSHLIKQKLSEHDQRDMRNATATEYENNYLLMIQDKIYVMDYSSSGFAYYTSYSSDERAQKALQWYVWDMKNKGPFHEASESGPKFLKNGMIVAESIGSLAIYTFKDGAEDEFLYRSGIEENEAIKTGRDSIFSTFTTKLYNFGRADVKKAVRQLYLSVRDDEGCRIRVSYLTERDVQEDAFDVTCEGEEGNGYIRTWRLTPNVNLAQAFGIRCDSDNGMAVQGIVLKYKHQGVVR